MNSVQLDESTANNIYNVLKQECGASESDRAEFIHYMLEPTDSKEFRFRGYLGFGGKFYVNGGRVYVGCYPEDRTDERRNMIRRAENCIAYVLLEALMEKLRAHTDTRSE